MSDSLHLNGPDANMSRDEYLSIIDEAKALDSTQLKQAMADVFVIGPDKTIDDLSDEELLTRKYRLQKFILIARAHLNAHSQAEDKRRKKVGEKIWGELDKSYKPKAIPETKKANNEGNKLAAMLAEELDISLEEAIERLKKM